MNEHGKRGTLRLAIYGKGGIGKSMIAANLSAAFAATSRSVLQIGCDPKHDSTRLLLGGRTVPTVLEHLENPASQAELIRYRRNLLSALQGGTSVGKVVAAGRGLPEGLNAEDVLHRGYAGTLCLEAGGPQPGLGCAGRGIITTFELLQKLKVDPDDFDVVIYDVLGDVVCGGFGVPMRHEHANAILLVTSEEYMPIYAANNILRGVKSYDRQQQRLAGLFLNRRDNDSSRSLIDRFSRSAQLPVVAELPRSPVIQDADHQGRTLAEAFPQSAEAAVFRDLAERLLDPSSSRHIALPMTDEALEATVLDRHVSHLHQIPNAPLPRARATTGEPRRLAIYGKGGIGKSTIAANLSAALASRGMRVLQVGCDPKHDSCRLLLGGRTVRTVLEYLRDVLETDRRLSDVVHTGELGVDCVEIGGPEPGIGCAGRGLLSAFALLEKLGLRDNDYDAIVYDVLGDVVCGGFAVPMRRGYAQSILLVTSEEYMPLYAANNILRGIVGVVGSEAKVAGVFLNVRDNGADAGAVERFGAAAGLSILARLPRSPQVQKAEQVSCPLGLAVPGSCEAQVFDRLAGQLLNGVVHCPAIPLDDEQLKHIVLGQDGAIGGPAAKERLSADAGLDEPSQFTRALADSHFCNFEQAPHSPFYYRQKPIRQPVWGCAYQGAVRASLRLRDAVVVSHAPRSCAYICRSGLTAAASRMDKHRGEHHPDMMDPLFVSTDMDNADMIYGGTDALTRTLMRVLADKPPVVFLVTACPPAIIGDDVTLAIQQARPVSPETRIIRLHTDGNMTGGNMNGHLSAIFDGLLEVIEAAPKGPVNPHSVNLVADWPRATPVIRRILSEVGVSINVSFAADDGYSRVADLRHLGGAPLTLMGSSAFITAVTAAHLRERFATQIARHPFPRGFRETELWLRDIGQCLGIEDRVERYLAPHRVAYEREIEHCRQVMANKRVVAFLWANGPFDWILDLLIDCGVEIPFVGVMAREEDLHFPIRNRHALPMEMGFHPDRRREVIAALKPDAVLSGSKHDLPSDVLILDGTGVGDDGVAFGPDLTLARRWTRLLNTRLREKWRDDVPSRAGCQLALNNTSNSW